MNYLELIFIKKGKSKSLIFFDLLHKVYLKFYQIKFISYSVKILSLEIRNKLLLKHWEIIILSKGSRWWNGNSVILRVSSKLIGRIWKPLLKICSAIFEKVVLSSSFPMLIFIAISHKLAILMKLISSFFSKLSPFQIIGCLLQETRSRYVYQANNSLIHIFFKIL
jgi:hypothetical protein